MTSPRRVVAMLLLVALPHLAGIDRAAVLAWSDSFTDGVDTSRWSFPLNGSCWRMDKGITFEDASTIYARRPGITLNLYNTPHDCPSSSARDHHQAAAKPAASSRSNIVVAGERAAAIGSQIEAACTPGPAISDMHHRQPSPADAGALAFFSMFRGSGRLRSPTPLWLQVRRAGCVYGLCEWTHQGRFGVQARRALYVSKSL